MNRRVCGAAAGTVTEGRHGGCIVRVRVCERVGERVGVWGAKCVGEYVCVGERVRGEGEKENKENMISLNMFLQSAAY